MTCTPRRENLVSQHIEVALVYKQMLGVEDAIAYLQRENIPRNIAEQLMQRETAPRDPSAAAPAPSGQTPSASCRRKNHVHDAIVEAALKIERQLGADWALSLLKKELVPDAVAARVIAQGPRQLRTRKRAP